MNAKQQQVMDTYEFSVRNIITNMAPSEDPRIVSACADIVAEKVADIRYERDFIVARSERFANIIGQEAVDQLIDSLDGQLAFHQKRLEVLRASEEEEGFKW